MKKILKKILLFIILYFAITFFFIMLMFGTYLLPNERIRGHIEESLNQLHAEGIGYTPFFSQTGALLDTHTDALMLNIAFNKGMYEGQSDFQRAVENSFYNDGDMIHSLEQNIHTGAFNNNEYRY